MAAAKNRKLNCPCLDSANPEEGCKTAPTPVEMMTDRDLRGRRGVLKAAYNRILQGLNDEGSVPTKDYVSKFQSFVDEERSKVISQGPAFMKELNCLIEPGAHPFDDAIARQLLERADLLNMKVDRLSDVMDTMNVTTDAVGRICQSPCLRNANRELILVLNELEKRHPIVTQL